MREPQTTSRVLMIRPRAFGANPETAASNVYQQTIDAEAAEVCARALAEADAYAEALRDAGVGVVSLDDLDEPRTPDAVFPNNWVSFHADGDVFLYPMMAPSRRAEVRLDLLRLLRDEHDLPWRRLIDLTPLCEDGAFLEGTGSLVLDRANRTAYACLSPRTTRRGLEVFAERSSYGLLTFRAVDRGADVYHTNVLMGIGPGFAAVCLDAIPDEVERASVAARLRETGHEVVALNRGQLRSFAGNLLALQTAGGDPVITLSRRAWASLESGQRETLERHGAIVPAAIETIERHGGGSARCMLAELHAPPAEEP